MTYQDILLICLIISCGTGAVLAGLGVLFWGLAQFRNKGASK